MALTKQTGGTRNLSEVNQRMSRKEGNRDSELKNSSRSLVIERMRKREGGCRLEIRDQGKVHFIL